MVSSLGIWRSSWGYIAVTILLAVLSTLAVSLRFWSRRISGLGVYVDDWLALGTLIIHHGLGATILVAFLVDGLGFDTAGLAENDAASAMGLHKLAFIGTILYGIGLTSIRLSLVLLYVRIFPTRAVRRGGYILAAVCITWFVAIEALNLATCQPIEYMWNRSIKGHCLNAPEGAIVLAAVNVIIDAVTVALPIHEAIKLNLSGEKKMVTCSIFLIGGIACAISLARLVSVSLYLTRSKKDTGTTSALLYATTGFEVYIAIIGACAPTLVPVYKRLWRRPARDDTPIPHRSGYTTKPSKKQSHTFVKGGITPAGLSRTALRESDEEERPFKRFDDIHVLVPAKERGEFWTDISARPASEGIPMAGIRVQRDVTWNSEE